MIRPRRRLDEWWDFDETEVENRPSLEQTLRMVFYWKIEPKVNLGGESQTAPSG